LLTYVNASVEQVLGMRREELIGHNVRELFPEALAAPFYREYERVLAEGTPAIFEAFYPPLGKWFETRLYPAADGVTAYLNDSTARRQMEEQLAQSLEREQAAHVEAERRREEAETARIEAETASQHLRQLQEVTVIALSHLALADLIPAVLDRICGAMEVDSAAILLLTEDGQELSVYSGRGALNEPVRIPFGQGIAGRIAASRSPLIIEDLSTVEVIHPGLRDQLRSVAGVPLVVEGRRIGALLVGSAVSRRFTDPHVRLLQLVGDRIALAIDHVQLYELAQAGYTEAEARASELAATFAAMTDGIFVSDQQGRRIRTNQAFRQLLGLDPQPDATEIPPRERSVLLDIRDTQGKPVSPERMPTARILRGEVLQGPTALDLTMRALDGRVVEANVTGAPVRTTDGGIVGAVAVYRDVTERRELERRTREALQSLLGMAEVLVGSDGSPGALPVSDSSSDTSAVVRRLAELARSLLGCKRISLTALDPETSQLKPMLGIGWPVDVEQRWITQGSLFWLQDVVPDALIERLRVGDVVVYDAANPALSGWSIHSNGQMLLAPMRINSRLIGLIGLDYGEPPHQYTPDERVLAGAVAQLSSAVIERERLLREREEAHASELASREATRRMELFMAMAGHELRTPLTVIKGYLQLTEQYLGGRLPDVEIAAPVARALQAARQSLAQAHQAAIRMTGLLDDLLQVSRAQTGKLSMHLEPCDLISIVRNAVEEQQQMNPMRQVQLRLPARRATPIIADPERIGQVVINYLTNADKYSSSDQPISVHIQVRRREVRVSVSDRGPGLLAADHEAIWGRFYQAPGVQRQVGSDAGMGLGLYVCRTIIEQHEGMVGVDSSVGSGSTFWFTLPLSPASL
ncbi:MAG TPA: GAF domain-containing protein, partial [Ktedonobacterales bacterium]|nr:GAF domain-containing protein [Ktedonobacterales bacterium]